jgi:hypothetical protein
MVLSASFVLHRWSTIRSSVSPGRREFNIVVPVRCCGIRSGAGPGSLLGTTADRSHNADRPLENTKAGLHTMRPKLSRLLTTVVATSWNADTVFIGSAGGAS